MFLAVILKPIFTVASLVLDHFMVPVMVASDLQLIANWGNCSILLLLNLSAAFDA